MTAAIPRTRMSISHKEGQGNGLALCDVARANFFIFCRIGQKKGKEKNKQKRMNNCVHMHLKWFVLLFVTLHFAIFWLRWTIQTGHAIDPSNSMGTRIVYVVLYGLMAILIAFFLALLFVGAKMSH